MESWKHGQDMEVAPLSNVKRTEGPEKGSRVRGLSRREFLRLAGVGAGAATLPGFLAACGGEQQQTRERAKCEECQRQAHVLVLGRV